MWMWAQPGSFDTHMQFTKPIDFGDKTLARRENATLAFSVCQNFTAFFFPSRI